MMSFKDPTNPRPETMRESHKKAFSRLFGAEKSLYHAFSWRKAGGQHAGFGLW
jgi:hypothetical protein